MKAGQVIEQDVQVQIPLVFKVNKTTREVEGICTQEVKDVHGEIVDHESMKAVLADWPGNIREMHQPIAVGKALKVESDDEQKATILRSRISKGAPDTWEKVLDGTLSMYSIGGTGKRITTKTADGAEQKRIVMSALHEISLVDNGACPTAKFEIVKSVDGVSVECQPEEPAEAEPAAQPATSEPTGLALLQERQPQHTKSVIVTDALATLIAKLATLSAEEVAKRSYPSPYMIDRTLAAISHLESILADEWWKALDLANYDQEGDHSTDLAQVQVLRSAIELVLAYLVSEFNAQFDNEAFVANVARAAAVVKAGARHSKADVSMIQNMHDTAISLGAACKVVDCEKCKEAAAKAAAPVETPAAPIQEPVETPAAPVVETPAAAPVQAAVGLTAEAIQKLIADGIATEVQKVQEASAKRIADLEGQVTKLAEQPAPGGPVTRAVAVQKQIGQPDVAALEESLDPQAVLDNIDALGKFAKTPAEKEELAQLVLRMQHRTGAGAMVIRRNPNAE